MIYIYDIETDNLLQDVTKIHCLCFSPLHEDKFYVFCNREELDLSIKQRWEADGVQFFDTDDYLKLINSPKTTGLICHNQLSYDLEVMKKFNGVIYDHNSLNKRGLMLIDTLVLSRYLSPDRRPPKGTKSIHGLEAWGVRTKIAKPVIENWSDQPLDVYVNRVIEDVKINKATYFMLLKEMRDIAIDNGSKKGDWSNPLKMSHKVYYLMCKQERTGVGFNQEVAKELITRIDKEMKEIEDEIEPHLGERVLPKGQQPKPPKQPWKRAFDYKNVYTQKEKLKKKVVEYLEKIGYTDPANQEKYINSMVKTETIEGHTITHNYIEDMLQKHHSLLSAHSVAYCNKIGIIEDHEMFNEILRLEKKGEKPVQLKEKLLLSHKKDVKEYLIKQGWKPTMFKPRNIVINPKTKQGLSKDEINIKLDKYLDEFHNSVYWGFIYNDLGYKNAPRDITSKVFRDKCIRKGRGLLSSPQYADARGVLCSNLAKMDEDSAKLIVKWLSLQNRKNTILSDNGTGWLAHPRLKVDGRLPASSSGITNTSRQKHSVVVNVPKPKDHVVLGKEMRSLFIPRRGYYQIGCDAMGLEARVMGHFTYPFDDGKFANEILEGDIHTKNSKAFSKAMEQEIIRDDTKNLFYAIIYGVSGKKAAVMASVDEKKGKLLIDSFWEANPGLAKMKEAVTKYWEASGRKYIMGIDGRKVFVRSAHSAMNALFQSTGAIIMDFAGCWADTMIKKEGLDFYRTLYVHDEYQGEHNIDEVEVEFFDVEPEQERDGKLWSKPKETGAAWTQHYSRAGELIARGIETAGKYYNMNLPFPGEYMIGDSWKDCH